MTAPSETRTPVLQVVLLFMAGLCAAGQFAKISVIFADVRALYPEAGDAAGFLVSLLSLIGIGLGLFAGLVVARVGFRRTLLVALAGGAAMSLFQASLPPLPVMLVSRAIEGAAHLAIVVAAPTLIIALSETRHQPIAMTLWSTIFGVTFALTAWLGIPLVHAVGPAALFVAHAAVTALTAILLLLLLPRDRIVPRTRAKLSLGEIARRHIEVYTSPSLAAPAAGFVFYTLTYVALMTLLPEHIDPEWRLAIVGMLPLMSIAASLSSGATLLRWFPAVNVAIGGFALGVAAATVFMILPGHPVPALVLFAALGLMQSASFAAIPQLVSDSDGQALANGAVAQAGNIGNTLGTPVLLAAASIGGSVAMMGLVVVFHICGALVHLTLARKRRNIA